MELTTTQMRAGFGSSLGRASQIAAYHAALNNAADQIETLRAELEYEKCESQRRHDVWKTTDRAYTSTLIELNKRDEELAELRARVGSVPDDVAKDAHRVHAIGLAVNRAARDLPDGYEIRIEIERDAGTVRLYSPDDEVIDHEWDGETFAGEIESAVDAAILSADTEVKK